MKLKQIIATLTLITLMGGVSVPLAGCNNQGTSTTTQSTTSTTVYLHSAFIEQNTMKNDRNYSLYVIDDETGKILINGKSFSCDSLNNEEGCQLNIPNSASDIGRLVFLVYDGQNLVAATSVLKSYIPTGLNNIYFNEDSTGEYLFDHMLNIYSLTSNDQIVKTSMYEVFGLDSTNHDDDMTFHVKLYLLYQELHKQYGENTFYTMIDLFNPDSININGSFLEHYENGTQTSMSKVQSTGITIQDTKSDIEKIIGCIDLKKLDNGDYYCFNQTSDRYQILSVDDINQKVVEQKQNDEDYKKIWNSSLTPSEKEAAAKALREKQVKQVASILSGLTPVANDIAKNIAKSMKVSVSEETKTAINAAKTLITIVGVVGNIWLPGASSAIAALTNGVLDGLFGGNNAAGASNPNAAMEAALGVISDKLDSVNRSVLGIQNKLSEMEKDRLKLTIATTVTNLNEITSTYNPLNTQITNYAKKAGKTFTDVSGYLNYYLQSGDAAITRVGNVFNNRKQYEKLSLNLEELVPNSVGSTSALDIYLTNYSSLLQAQLDSTTSGVLFSPSRNKIQIVREYNVELVNYMINLSKVIHQVGSFYKMAAYLKYLSPYKSSFQDIYLGKYDTGSYDTAKEDIDAMVQLKDDVLAKKIKAQLEKNISSVENGYFSRVDRTWFKANNCEATYWDGKTFVGKCGDKSFVIPDLSACKDNVTGHGDRVYCSTFNYYNVDKFSPGVAGSDAAKSATDKMLQTWSTNDSNLRTDAGYLGAQWTESNEGIRYDSFIASRNIENDGGGAEGQSVFMTATSDPECFNDTWHFENGNALRRRNYPVLSVFRPTVFSYIFINKTFDTNWDTCPGGVNYTYWWANGRKVHYDSNEVTQNKAIQRTYVDIQDTANDKSFIIPMITKYQSDGIFADRSYYYYTTLACTTSDCVILDAGGVDGSDRKPQRLSIIAWLDKSLSFEKSIYMLGVQNGFTMGSDKFTTLTNLEKDPDAAGDYNYDDMQAIPKSARGMFVLFKSESSIYYNGKDGVPSSPMPKGDWLTKCDGRSFVNGMLISAASCKGSGIEGKTQTGLSLNWNTSCLAGSPVDVNQEGYLVCRYPR